MRRGSACDHLSTLGENQDFDDINEAGGGKGQIRMASGQSIGQKRKVIRIIKISNHKYIIIYDTGADIHVCNMKKAYIPGTLRKHHCVIAGIDAQVNDKCNDERELVSYETGDIKIQIGNYVYILKDVAYVNERLDDNERDGERNSLLISIRLAARQNKLGTFFKAGGNSIGFFDENDTLIEEIKIDVKDEAYIQRGATNFDHYIRHSKTKTILVNQKGKPKGKNKVKSIPKDASQGDNQGKFSRGSSKDDPKVTAIPKDTCQGEKSEKKEKISQKQKKKPNKEPNLARKLHNRMHFGKTKPVLDFIKKAYGLDAEELKKLTEDPCDACDTAKAKFSKPKHRKERPKPNRPGERIVWDIFTSNKRTKTGIKYMLVIVDLYSDYTWVYGLKKKSEASDFLVSLIKRLERRSKSKTKSLIYAGAEVPVVQGLRADGGGENWTKPVTDLAKKLGIETEESISYCQYQNGTAERVGAIVWENGQALRFAAKLPEDDWFRSMCTYVHMKNRLPNAAHPKKTAIELFYNFKANPLDLIDHFKTFGCLCIVNYPREIRKAKGKLCPKAWKGVFLGYSEDAPDIGRPTSRGYFVRNMETGKMKKVTDAQVFKFHEKTFPTQHTSHTINNDYYSDDDADGVNDDDSDAPDLASSSDEDTDDDSEEPDLVSSSDEDTDYDSESDSDSEEEPREESVEDDDESDDELVDDIDHDRNAMGYPRPGGARPQTRSQSSKTARGEVEIDEVDEDEKHENESSETKNDVNDIDYDESYELENVIAHKYSRNGGTNYLCQWDSGDKFTYSYEPRSNLKDQDLEAFVDYEYNMKNNKEDTYHILDSVEQKSGAILEVYDHDHSLIKHVYDERGWDHSNNLPSDVNSVRGESASPTFETEVNKKINCVRKRIRKIRKIKTTLGEERDNGDEPRSKYVDELNDEIEVENLRIKILKSAKFKTNKIIREKGGVEIPDTHRHAEKRQDYPKWLKAMDVEWKSFFDKDVIEYIPRSEIKGKNIVSVRWVYDIKLETDMETIKRYKARLVARGFTQRYGVDYDEIFAPTMNVKSMRILLALAAREGIEVQQYDVSNAFLHASLDKDVYIEQPSGYDDPRYPRDKYVIKLKRAMYGLKNAGRAWSLHLMSALKKLGFTQNSKDDCLWTYRKGTSYIHYLFHVDDIMAVANDATLRAEIFEKLKSVMDIKDEGPMIAFLGMRITRADDGSYFIDQEKYIEKIAKRFGVDIKQTKKRKTPGDYGSKLTNDMLPKTNQDKKDALNYDMPGLVGALIYVIRTRFDVSYAISDVSRFMGQWGKAHYDHGIRILEYLYQTKDKKIHMNAKLLQGTLKLSLYVDANYGDDRESLTDDVKWKSQGGYLLFLGGVLVSWCSRRHHIRVLSSMESEYVEASDASKEVQWARQLVNEVGHPQTQPTIIYEDNTACINFTKLGKISERTKHIDIRKYYLKQLQRDSIVDITHISTDIQLADMMTKYILVTPFIYMRDKIFNGIECHTTYATSEIAKIKARKSKA